MADTDAKASKAAAQPGGDDGSVAPSAHGLVGIVLPFVVHAPAARFRNELEDYMSEGAADETLKTVVSWARYAELFAYDEQSETFSLENPH